MSDITLYLDSNNVIKYHNSLETLLLPVGCVYDW